MNLNTENTMKPATQINLNAFNEQLAKEYVELFKTPEYEYSASRITPEALARKMTLGLDNGSANKDGDGIKRTCKHFKIAHTYKAIREFLKAQ
jgi:hypothetical protein